MRSRTPLPARGQGQVRPFLEAAVLFAALCIFARSAALGLAAAITAPLPMAETLLWLGRQAAGETASSVQEQTEPERAGAERVEAEIVYLPMVAEPQEYQYNADAFEARDVDEVKQEAAHKEVSKVREDKAR